MPPCRILLVLALAMGAAFPAAAFGQNDDDEALSPGLLARFTAQGRTVECIDPDVAFTWDDDAPIPRLAAGPFEAAWRGQLLVQQEGQYSFHAFVAGEVAVSIGGRPVARGALDEPGWITGPPVSLDFGEKALEVTYRKTGKAARVQIFWSSDRFPLEPVPAHLLFLEAPRPDLHLIEEGRREYEAHRCGRCHRREDEFPIDPAPALTQLANGVPRAQIIAAIGHAGRSDARMPDFGFSPHEARAIAAYLVANAAPAKLEPLAGPPDAPADRRAGERLVRTRGCLACHRVGELGQNGPFGGGDLSHVGDRKSPEWIHTWLAHPERLNPDHRMPVFSLSKDERRQLTAYLSRLKAKRTEKSTAPPDGTDDEEGTANDGLIAEGRALVAQARCAACHRLPEGADRPAAFPKPLGPVQDASNSCLASAPDRARLRPAYGSIDRDALKAYLAAEPAPLSPPGRFARGERLLERRNCTACHRRDGAGGLAGVAGDVARHDAALRGQSETLMPPFLNAVGDKLVDDALGKAIRGEQRPRMPWLQVQMPRFNHPADEQEVLTAYLVNHDRIPAGAPAGGPGQTNANDNPSQTGPNDAGRRADEETLIAGHALVGVKGFSCLACHQAGKFVPRNTAPATRGSDLLTLGGRMRREFFLRWTRSPLRIAPGVEMPSYERPVPGILNGDVDRQLAALWSALIDPRFTAPTNPTSVEQFLVVGSDEPARIVRDFFTNPKTNGGGNIARGFAVGLNSGHNVLYDLSSFSVRQWTLGDFARQRTEGKSWYWDMAGLAVATGFPAASDLALAPRAPAGGALIQAHSSGGTCGRLLGYQNDGAGVSLAYELNFEVSGGLHAVHVTESVQPVPREAGGGAAGWERRISAARIPEGYDVVLVRPEFRPLLGEPRLELIDSGEWEQSHAAAPVGPGIDEAKRSVASFARLRSTAGDRATAHGEASLQVRYLCTAIALSSAVPLQPLPAPEAEEVTTVPGFDGLRLPLPRSIMPTSIAWNASGGLCFSSLKGHVYAAQDTNGDGLADRLGVFEEGLSSPYGLIADGDDLIVSHKPELLRLTDADGDGRADRRQVVATGWGITDNYHDWTCGIVRDTQRNLYVALGSDYTQKNRPKELSLWRGKALRIDPAGNVTPVGHALRYATGLAIDAHDRVFLTDQQGEQNTFNEINLLVEGSHYGVPARHDDDRDAPAAPPSLAVPHPWTRSVNGIVFLPETSAWGPLAGHGIGCEYDSRFLIRFTVQIVDGVAQGAVYYFSRPDGGTASNNFLGPLCAAVGPDDGLYIGSIHDSGWLGGQNTGDVVRLRYSGRLPNGIREVRALPDGFEIAFFSAIDKKAARDPANYSIAGYTRKWSGGYATPDSGRHRVSIGSVEVAADATSVRLRVDRLREGYVYEVSAGRLQRKGEVALFPATGHYTLLRIPSAAGRTR